MDRKKAFLKTPIGTVRIIGTSVGIQEVSFVESHDSIQAEVFSWEAKRLHAHFRPPGDRFSKTSMDRIAVADFWKNEKLPGTSKNSGRR